MSKTRRGMIVVWIVALVLGAAVPLVLARALGSRDLSERARSLQSDVVSEQARLVQIEAELKTLQAELASLLGQQAGLTATFDLNLGSIDQLNARIDELTNARKRLEHDLAAAEASASAAAASSAHGIQTIFSVPPPSFPPPPTCQLPCQPP